MKKILSVILGIVMVLSLCSCASSKYEEATELMARGDYISAKQILIEIIDYENSEELLAECEDKITVKKLLGNWSEKGEKNDPVRLYARFNEDGTYEQGITLGSDEAEPFIINSGSFTVKNGIIYCGSNMKWELDSSNNLIVSDESGRIIYEHD